MSYAVSLEMASLARCMLSTIAVGDASQTTPVQIMHGFMSLCCAVLHVMLCCVVPACAILIPCKSFTYCMVGIN